jgi:5'-3' exonuclease
MIQPIRKRVAEANNVDTKKYKYTLLIDGNNIMKIASVDHKMNSDGKEYGIILTSLRLIGDTLKKKDFDYCIVAYDGEGSGVLRYQYYKDYKANRDKNYELHNPNKSEYDKYIENYARNILRHSRENAAKESEDDSFARQKPILQSILDELCIRQYEFENVEGDDIISYYVKNKKDDEKVVIVSSDRDLTQLISDTVCIYNPRDKEFITKENAVKKLGILSENIVLQKIICGDVSDNIKGVKGVGLDTLKKLFPEFTDKKLDLDFVIGRSKELLEQRKAEKKKPLKSLENIVNGTTDGCQGDRLYEINKKIIDLSTPLLTEEAKKTMDDELYAVIDTTDRSIKNIYEIVSENKINDILDENKFGNILEPFGRIIMMENKRLKAYLDYEKFRKENGKK